MPIAGALAVYLLAWTFLSGGILDRYARQRPHARLRILRRVRRLLLALPAAGVIAGVVYWLLFSYVHPWLFDDAYEQLTADLAVERDAFLWRVGLYVVFGAALMRVQHRFDYAKVRLVVEDRRSALGALRPRSASSAGIPGARSASTR